VFLGYIKNEWSVLMEPKIEIQLEENESFLEKYFLVTKLPTESQTRLLESQVVLLPNIGLVENPDILYFPSDTSELVFSLKSKIPKSMNYGLLIREDEYKEVAFHADIVYFADIFVKYVAVPFVVSFLASYLVEKLGRRLNISKVKSRIIIQSGNRFIDIKYEGPAEQYQEALNSVIQKELKSNNDEKKD
jgi:hypothetical protein